MTNLKIVSLLIACATAGTAIAADKGIDDRATQVMKSSFKERRKAANGGPSDLLRAILLISGSPLRNLSARPSSAVNR